MNWQRIHDQIISKAKGRILDGYSERHHIIPKCLGGTDNKENLVALTAKEHFIIHKILCLIYPNESKLHWAAFRMANGKGNKKQDRSYRIGSREYQRLKENLTVSKETRKKLSEANKGKQSRLGAKLSKESKEKIRKRALGRPSPIKGKKLSKEHRKKLSDMAKKRKHKPHSEETKQKMRAARKRLKENGWEMPTKGVPRSEDTKEKISNSKKGVRRGKFSDEWLNNLSKSLKGKAKGKIWINDGTTNTMIDSSKDIPDGWERGMLRKNRKQ